MLQIHQKKNFPTCTSSRNPTRNIYIEDRNFTKEYQGLQFPALQTRPLLLVVAVPARLALSPLKSDTHFSVVGLDTLREVYVHFPGPPLACIAILVLVLSTSVMALLSPFLTFELHDTEMVPDCRDSHV